MENSPNKPSVTIAITALNEGVNIKRFLESALSQREENFTIQKILVISDGSTDGTVDAARSFHDPRIELRAYSERLGKSARMNEIFQTIHSDFIVQADADVTFAHDRVVSTLIEAFLRDARVGMCGGNPLPLPSQTFTGQAIRCTLDSYLPLRSILKNGHNIYSVLGCLLAYRKEFYKNIHMPDTMTSNDIFVYFQCLTMGHEYRHVPEAVVWYRLPQTLKDHIRQNVRFASGPLMLESYFPPSLIKREYHIPFRLKLRYRLEQLVRHPILSIYIYVINTYCRFYASRTWYNQNPLWKIVHSTKQ